MEQLRLLLAIFLTIMVFLLWELLFVPKQQPVQPPAGSEQTSATREVARQHDSGAVSDSKDSLKSVPEMRSQGFGSIVVETELYKAEISEKGAAISRFFLKQYQETMDGNGGLKQLVPESNFAGTALSKFSAPGFEGMDTAVFTTDTEQSSWHVRNKAETISFFWTSPRGIVVEKQYVFYPQSYKIGLNITLANTGNTLLEPGLMVEMTNPMPDGGTFVFEGPFAYIDGSLEEIKPKKIKKEPVRKGEILWTGIEDRYFMTAVVPENPAQTEIRLQQESRNQLLRVAYVEPVKQLSPGSGYEYQYNLFMGPKKISELQSFGHGLDKAINFGFFDIIAKPCLWLMNAIHDNVVANYGVAIIMLTMLFKIIFFPLGNKSYRSMAEMKKLQPLMTEIRKKYKDDKKKMNEEVMRLYKTYKVNPMSGCLPMVVQIPVFIAFYRMLYESIELRHAPFFLWINDLSAPDRLFNFAFSIPFMAPPYGVPVLTIIMGATMFLQQKLSPPPGDPSQAKIMMMLPLIFTFIFINFPAGLVLYWLTNNVLSIAQQYYITRKTA